MLPHRCLSRRLFVKAICSSLYTRSAYASFSTSSRCQNYDDTIDNLRIGKHTRVIFQGFTGKQATANAKESLEWGTNIVGGVKPGATGEHLGLPVLPSVRAAMEQLKPDATGIYVAAHQATAAIEEAIEAEIPLIVAVAEHIPLHDIMRIHSILATQSKSRLVGANAPGIISAIGKCRIGFQPLSTYSPGHVGVVAKSGTLSYETVGSLTRAGLGQSLCIAVGGDVIAGTNFIDALKVFETDEDTEAIIIVGELGGTTEEEAADWITEYRKRTKNPKPIAAVIGGFQAPPGKVMGHAGAWTGLGEGTAESKYKALENAGVTMVDHPAKFGNVMKDLLAKSGRSVRKIEQSAAQQRRSYHTSIHRPSLPRSKPLNTSQHRSLHLSTSQSTTLLKSYNIPISDPPSTPEPSHFLGITVARSARSPCIIAAPTTNPQHLDSRVRRFPFDYRTGPSESAISSAIQYMQLDSLPANSKASIISIIHNLYTLYKAKEAITTTLHLTISPTSSPIFFNPTLIFDDAAFKSCNRQSDIHALRDTSQLSEAQLLAEKSGIVYIPLPTPPELLLPDGSEPQNLIGTLVNGAGLAMNTNDVLSLRLLSPPLSSPTTSSNFLDTGGKATSLTISTSFQLLLSDPRVAVIFVNIFGGLTLCDMIAEGIVRAFREVGVDKPVVVRLRGTREKEGREVLRRSGLPVWAFDGFEDAVECLGKLARGDEVEAPMGGEGSVLRV